MKNWKKFTPGPISLVLGIFIGAVMIATWGGRCPYALFDVFGAGALPVFLGLLFGGMSFVMYLFLQFIMWYDDWRER